MKHDKHITHYALKVSEYEMLRTCCCFSCLAMLH